MNGRAALFARGGVLGLIALLAVGYVRYNVGFDEMRTSCLSSNDVEVCDCVSEGYTTAKTIFTEAPVFNLVLGHTDQSFAQHMSGFYESCGYTA